MASAQEAVSVGLLLVVRDRDDVEETRGAGVGDEVLVREPEVSGLKDREAQEERDVGRVGLRAREAGDEKVVSCNCEDRAEVERLDRAVASTVGLERALRVPARA